MLKLNTDDGNDENELFLRNGWPMKDLISSDYCQTFSQTFDTLQARFAESEVGRKSNEGGQQWKTPQQCEVLL